MDLPVEGQKQMERLKQGDDFPPLAVKLPIDPTTNEGGFPRNLDPTRLKPGLRDVLRGIGCGEVCRVTRISEGYAILVIDREYRPSAMGVDSTTFPALRSGGRQREKAALTRSKSVEEEL
jgi:hypothetical protein